MYISLKNRPAAASFAFLACAALIGTAYGAGVLSSRPALGSTADNEIKEIRPAHGLRLIAQSLQARCVRQPTRTVTMDQEDVDRLHRLARQAAQEEEIRLTQASRLPR
jgi:hypothetical protein